MMSVMTRRTILPLLLMLAVLAVAVALTYQTRPVGAQSGDTLAAPKVTLTGAATCNPENPRTYVAGSYTRVDGASSYEFRMKWGRSANWTDWAAVPAGRGPGRAWPPSTHVKHLAQPE